MLRNTTDPDVARRAITETAEMTMDRWEQIHRRGDDLLVWTIAAALGRSRRARPETRPLSATQSRAISAAEATLEGHLERAPAVIRRICHDVMTARASYETVATRLGQRGDGGRRLLRRASEAIEREARILGGTT